MPASEIRSSARVAPRSVSRDSAVSAITSSTLTATDSTHPVRFRTVGDVTCTGCVESVAVSVEDVIAETALSRLTERGATRADDRISEAGMEDRKREGYF